MVEPENLFLAWDEFKIGKQKKLDVQSFQKNLEQNIFKLHRELKDKTYRHGAYEGFYIHDPKRRHIHKATVRDRVLHHAVFRVLNPIFEPMFITNSFSCRIGKGTHKGVDAIEKILAKASNNYTGQCYALKCDIKKFFDSIDHKILLSILKKRIGDVDMKWLFREIIGSYPRRGTREYGASRRPRNTDR
jgi:retron-type reverse transcriptase